MLTALFVCARAGTRPRGRNHTTTAETAASSTLCKAYSLITSGRKGELLCRLVNTDVHGRPDRCPKCKSKLHLVCEPSDMQPNTPVRLKCHHWHFNPAGGSKPCGWEAAITAANKSSLLRLPLADSWEGDLAMYDHIA